MRIVEFHEMSKGIFNLWCVWGIILITPSWKVLRWKMGTICSGMENQKSWQRLNTEVSISVKPFKDLLTMRGLAVVWLIF